MLAALFLTAAAWVVFSFIARVIDYLTGYGQPSSPTQAPPQDDGRENVRVVNRP